MSGIMLLYQLSASEVRLFNVALNFLNRNFVGDAVNESLFFNDEDLIWGSPYIEPAGYFLSERGTFFQATGIYMAFRCGQNYTDGENMLKT